ncbi:lipid II flippase MurJ [uncultured Roseibium sp.]|uniref:lipid II flippase MurJ n=1 Tax=uncultured Roseibium sp. TaxID=1936171 RepID=UPI0032180D33
MEFSLVLTLPAAVALAVIPREIVSVLFQRGKFDAVAVEGTAMALAAFAFGLPAFVLNKVFSPGYFAREDTKTPMWFAAIGMVVNVALSVALFPLFKHVRHCAGDHRRRLGSNTSLLGFVLWRRGHFLPDVPHSAKGRSDPRRKPADGRHPALFRCGPVGMAVRFGPADSGGGALRGLVGVGMASFAVFAQVTGASNLIGHAKSLKRRNT